MSDRLKSWLFCLLFFGGFLLVGSDGPYFPWPNAIGAVMAGLSILLIPAVERYADECERE